MAKRPPCRSPTRIRIMAEYGCVWPVWGKGSGMHNGDEELPVCTALRQDLLDWQEFFEEHLALRERLGHSPSRWEVGVSSVGWRVLAPAPPSTTPSWTLPSSSAYAPKSGTVIVPS